jgi:predicted RNase H-like HicB family nuclease
MPKVRNAAVQYVVVYEQTTNNWSAYIPDLPGCVAAGDTREEVEQLIREAIVLHVDALREIGEQVPPPGTRTGVVEIERSPPIAGSQ